MSFKLKKILLIITIVVIALAPIPIAYAWFTPDGVGKSLSFQMATMDSSVAICKGEDFNHDGNLDLDIYGNPIYGTPQVSDGSTILTFTANNVMPTQIHTWKITVTNLGDTRGYVFFRLGNNFGEVSLDEDKILKALSVSVYNFQTGEIIGEKSYLAEFYENGILSCVALNGGVANSVGFNPEVSNTRTFIFCIEFEAYEDLPLVNGEKPLTESEYQGLQNSTFDNLFMKIYLTSNNTLQYSE